MTRDMGGDQRDVQGATTTDDHALRHGPLQDLTIKGLQQWTDTIAEGKQRLRDAKSTTLQMKAEKIESI